MDEKEEPESPRSPAVRYVAPESHMTASPAAMGAAFDEYAPDFSESEMSEEIDDGVEEKTEDSVEEHRERCRICYNEPVDPIMSPCNHICCKSCWTTYFKEHAGNAMCQECGIMLSPENMRSVRLCHICGQVPRNEQRSRCRHYCCKQCWIDYLAENQECPECSAPVTLDSLV